MLCGIDDGIANNNGLEVLHLWDCFNRVGSGYPMGSAEPRQVPEVFFGILGGIVDI